MLYDRINHASGAPWESIAGYSRLVEVGPFLEVAGTTAVEEGKVQAPGDAAAQTRIILRKIEAALQGAGATLGNVVRTRIFLTNIRDWEAVTRVHGEFFGTIRPACTLVEVSALIDPEMLVEIEASAIKQSNDEKV